MRLLSAAVAVCVLAAGAAQAQQSCRDVYVENKCFKPIRILIEHAPSYRNWEVVGWYDFEPDERSRLLVDNDPMCHLLDHSIYFYAESTDGEYTWAADGGEDDSEVQYNGSWFDLRKANKTLYRGGTKIDITCD